jgi:hypothetical protein
LIYLKVNRKKNKNGRENKIVSIANKNFKTSFYINQLQEPLEFSSREKGENKNQKGWLMMLTRGYFFRKKRSKIIKLKK